MRKGPGIAYIKWNISVLICDTDIPEWSTKSWWRPQNFRSDDFNVTLYQGSPERNHKLWNIASTEIYTP